MRVDCQRCAPAAVLPEKKKDPVPIVQDARCASATVWSGAENLAQPGFDLQTFQPVAGRYTDWVTPVNPTVIWPTYTGCPRRNGQNFGRVFLMLNYTDITQNTYIQSWTVTEIMTIEKRGLLGCPRTVRRPWRHTHPLRMPGNETPLAKIVMQRPWRDNGSAAACVNYLETQGQIRQ